MKTCRECNLAEPEIKFYASRRTNVCAKCENKRTVKNRSRQYIDRFDDEEKRRYRRNAKLKYKYKMTLDDYEKMLKDQGGVCVICRRYPEERDLCVDHDHATGLVRGLLCDLCNRMLGQSGDNAELLEAGAKYLRSFYDEG